MDFVQGGTNWRPPILFLPLSFFFLFPFFFLYLSSRVNVFGVVVLAYDSAEYYHSNWYSRVLMEARSKERTISAVHGNFPFFFLFFFFFFVAQGFVVTPAFPVLFLQSSRRSFFFLSSPLRSTVQRSIFYIRFFSCQTNCFTHHSVKKRSTILINRIYIFIRTLLTRNFMKIFWIIRRLILFELNIKYSL